MSNDPSNNAGAIGRRARSALRRGLLRRRAVRAGVALVYHRVGDPPGDRARELVPNHGKRLFQDQLRYLSHAYHLVAPSQLQAAASARAGGEPYPVAITFDDDLSTHHAEAAPILTDFDAPAAFFVGGGSFDAPRARWWNVLQTVADQDLIDAEVVEAVLGAGSGVAADRGALKPLARAIEAMAPAERENAETMLARRVDPSSHATSMRADEVRGLADKGFEIGFHTVEHHLLTALPDADVDDALRAGRDRVAAAAGRPLDMLSYPHGKADGRVAGRAAAAGYRTGFTGAPGAVSPMSDPLLLGRVEPSFASVGELAAQLNAIFAAAETEPA